MEIAREYLEIGQDEGLSSPEQAQIKAVVDALSEATNGKFSATHVVGPRKEVASEPAPPRRSQARRVRLHADAPLSQRQAVAERVATLVYNILLQTGQQVPRRDKFVYALQKDLRNRAELEKIYHDLGGVVDKALAGQNWIGAWQRVVGRSAALTRLLEQANVTHVVMDLA